MMTKLEKAKQKHNRKTDQNQETQKIWRQSSLLCVKINKQKQRKTKKQNYSSKTTQNEKTGPEYNVLNATLGANIHLSTFIKDTRNSSQSQRCFIYGLPVSSSYQITLYIYVENLIQVCFESSDATIRIKNTQMFKKTAKFASYRYVSSVIAGNHNKYCGKRIIPSTSGRG